MQDRSEESAGALDAVLAQSLATAAAAGNRGPTRIPNMLHMGVSENRGP